MGVRMGEEKEECEEWWACGEMGVGKSKNVMSRAVRGDAWGDSLVV